MVQYCARHYYNSATLYNNTVWLLSIFSAIFFNIYIIKDSLGNYRWLFMTCIIIINGLLNKYMGICINRAAMCRKYVDYTLFDFSGIDDSEKLEICEYATKVKQHHYSEYKKQIEHTGTDKTKGVKDWYTSITDDMDMETAIKKCQIENQTFDKELTSITLKSIILLIVIIVAIIVLININETILNFIAFLYPFISLIIKAYTSLTKITKLNNFYNKDNAIFNNSSTSLLERQKIIDDRRLMPVMIPNVIHKIYSNLIHEIVKNRSIM